MMTSMQEIEIQRYQHKLVGDLESLLDKYRRIMEWDIPEGDEKAGDKLIIEALQQALNKLKQNKNV
ncbi:MAG: hypothetical protein ACWA5R_11835 [bacterium]